MPFGPAYGGAAGAGSLIVATRSDNSNPAVFADFAALETYTATQDGTTDANRINVSDADFAQEVFAVGTLSAGNDVTAITAAYIRLNNDWVAVATNLVGTPGQDGADGTDGLDVQFESITARDTYFTSNPSDLITGMPIFVHDDTADGQNVVLQQVWQGADRPSSYNPATDAVFFQAATVRADTSSFELGDVHKITSGGENVYFENQDSDTNYFPPWQSVGDHRTPAGRTVQNRPTARTYQDLRMEEFGGAVAASGAVDYDVDFTLPSNESVHGVRVVAAEAYTGEINYRVDRVRVGGNINVYNHTEAVTTTVGGELELWFDVPLDGRVGTETRIRLEKPDGSLLSVRPTAADDTEAWTEVRLRGFNDDGLAYENELIVNKDRAVVLNANLTISSANVDDYNNMFLYVPSSDTSSSVYTVTIEEDSGLEGMDMFVFGDASISLSTSGAGQINGATSVDIEMLQGGRLIVDPGTATTWGFLFEASQPLFEDRHVDDIIGSVANNVLTLTTSRTGGLADITTNVNLPSTRTDEDIRDVMGTALVAGAGVSITVDDAGDTITISSTSVGFQRPVISSLTIEGQARDVTAGTTISGDATFNFEVTNPSNVSGNLTLIQQKGSDPAVTLATDINPTSTSTVETLTSVTLAAGEEVTWTLSGTDTQSNNFTRSFRVRAPEPTELFYYGLSDSNNPDSVDISGFTSAVASSGGQATIATGDTSAGDYFIILVPADTDITSIRDTVIGNDVTSIFTRTPDVRMISSAQYNSYAVGPLTDQLSETYEVRF